MLDENSLRLSAENSSAGEAVHKADAACGTDYGDLGEGGLHVGGSNPTSDDDQLVIDERKQKRMLSNRESARRSRLRKQQHLDELQGQVQALRVENNMMMGKYTAASHQYVTITEENRRLRSHATELAHQLQRLHHAASAQHPGGLAAFGLNPGPTHDFYSYRSHEGYSSGIGLGPTDVGMGPSTMGAYPMMPMPSAMPYTAPPLMNRVRSSSRPGSVNHN
eukprot:TRINITY_DN14151_c0_g1_i1.p1 TRINITY_DN14151_c0_g1~~TRINITY_DN14151_c0_g1_i1.p1  ORF type:complete len:221 (+),score=40.58 TRINITY_DN14151_c0_g1_i1:117-779(+)